MQYRNLRVSQVIQEELSKLVAREMEFDGALVTITGVETGKKLEAAKVKVSIIPSGKARDALAKLHDAQGHLQHLLLKKMNIVPMPRIMFELDHGSENVARVEKLLGEE